MFIYSCIHIYITLKKSIFSAVMSETEINSRLPDFGPLNIKDYNEFLEQSKIIFDMKWGEKITHNEDLSDFNKVEPLGSGTFGYVVLVNHKRTRKYYAMKSLEKEQIVVNNQLENLKSEINALQCLNFPFTVYLQYLFKDNSYIYMVMPFIPGGELFYHLRKFGKFEEEHTRFYTTQVILTFEYLHYLNLIYRDLKPENVLLDHTGYIKLTDFGFCKRLMKSRTYTMCGTPEYMAPEIILNKGYGKAVDWWALGVFIFELVSGSPPFTGAEVMRLFEKIIDIKYKIPSFFSSELKDLIKNILQEDVTRRYGNLRNGADDIKKHKWFEGVNWETILNRQAVSPYQPDYKRPGDTSNFDKVPMLKIKKSKEDMYSEEFEGF